MVEKGQLPYASLDRAPWLLYSCEITLQMKMKNNLKVTWSDDNNKQVFNYLEGLRGSSDRRPIID
jgi:hypothetical protein